MQHVEFDCEADADVRTCANAGVNDGPIFWRTCVFVANEQCWCVDADGTELAGTRTRPVRPPMSLPHGPQQSS